MIPAGELIERRSLTQRGAAVDPDAIADAVRAGDLHAVARALTLIERRSPAADRLLARVHDATGRAHVVGVTGPAGSGKSTLVSALAAAYRRMGRRVGILAVDPSSTYSGGAILGDRIRMGDLAGNPGVYIRSFATRGATGGLSRAVLSGIGVLDAAGMDVVILETVGVGQAEVDIVSVAHTVAVVSVPGLGDEVQAIKAGLLEIADVHVVNKADRPGADQTVAQLREVLRLSRRQAGQWNVPIQQTVATTDDGVQELLDLLDRHRQWARDNGALAADARRDAAARIRWAAEDLLRSRLRLGNAAFDAAVGAVVSRTTDPTAAARTLLDSPRTDGPATSTERSHDASA